MAKLLAGVLGAAVVFGGTGITAAAADPGKTVKIAFTDAPTLQIGDQEYNHPSYAAMLAFQSSFEKSTGNEYSVELYPGGTLGDAASNLEELQSGTLQGATPADGALSAFALDIQVFTIPYLFTSPLQAYDVLDGEFGQKLFDKIADETGLRVIASYDNGGYRNFTNNKKEIRSAADMQSMKFRVMDSPVYMKLVESMGSTGTPVAFLELYSALQTGVVDGQENSAITTLGASLDEVQKYCILDGHLLGLAFLTISNDWYNGLDPATQEKVLQAGREASIAARGICRQAEGAAVETLKANGVQVYTPTEDEIASFRDASQQPVVDWLKENIDPALVDELLNTVNNGGVGQGRVSYASAETAAVSAETNDAADTALGTAAAETSAGSGNTLTILFAVIAAVAVLLAAFAMKKNRKPEEKK
ncbi:TRAP transporter substrate-binding protein [Lachnoclostridium sp. Marseille-P6806]|uniref:TRAP transporter substrate-binding protein n=1 Tax=Lachnoclostridium sp. Marseille-P6806 TaxID=2364793 RepID=UPI0013EEF680|nr:TRAP transporter substrate-binding protein DctP [Lachnoclostridium sp. Marseille-P6806]